LRDDPRGGVTDRWIMGRDGDRGSTLLRTAGLFAGVSLLLGLLEAAQLYVRNAMDAHPIPASEAQPGL